ncbi:MAG: N-acetyl sugar amidotransferase [Chitinophagales bacterium]|nr:N-acetyl sugar amidotransferase [Chitinophagales bacterium]
MVVACKKCILDSTDDPNIKLDSEGVCNYCHEYDRKYKECVLTGTAAEKKINDIVQKIKSSKPEGEYNCILGLSGGVDSSYLALLAKKYDLKPLCLHFDNGWNSELAVKNIENIVNKLGFELETYVINWPEFRDLQRAYLKAGVIDIEALTDHAIFAALYQTAVDRNIKYVLSGFNIVTEGIMVDNWTYRKADYINILDIHEHYGEIPLKSYPMMNRKLKKKINNWVETVEFLNWIDYNKQEVKNQLQKELDWKDYGGKHYESIFTRFYQAYILPVKFKVDKRKVHLSNLICSGQITREEALEEMKKPLYDEQQLKVDREFVLKKLGYTSEEFDEIMRTPPRRHDEFKKEGSLFYYYPILMPLRPLWERYKKMKSS